ncbi:glycosyl transferase [Nocardioides silvaticus]|uniref:Glycosyl transferase n=1 Tax=Nocardioides silvaticus TaxID=2201891 RepID=A0A316T946_9ACTN|nr:glycosyltransferase family 4 protein [Nocardioides silvaticus]PWN00833.1 glycosyl transferase [Nocardioides silvaticus]
MTPFLVPVGIDDPALPSGGNRYDRRVIDELRALGRVVHEHRVTPADVPALLDEIPDRTVVLVDGLLATQAPDVLVPTAKRLALVVLLHMPFAETFPALADAEREVLTSAAGVVTTSKWARRWVVAHHGLDPERVTTATPGADPARAAHGSRTGVELLCLAAVTRAKGHDVLLSALGEIADLDWRYTCAGTLQLEPDFVAGLRDLAARSGIGDRVRFTGPLGGADLDAALSGADLLVSASRHEAYGMGVTEALAHAVPVVASDVGGHPEAVEGAGLLVPPDDPDRLADALRTWLESPRDRRRLRRAAADRRTTLAPWRTTADRIAAALDEADARGGPP